MTGFVKQTRIVSRNGNEMDIKQEITLINFIESNLGRAFAWGECDCNIFVLEAMDAVFGTALAAKIRGRYITERGAIRFRRQSPWGSLITLLQEAGFVEGQKGFEHTGDLLIVEDPGKWEMAHIYLGRMAAAAFPGEGVQQFPLVLMKDKPYSVWRYPCLQ